MTDAPKDLKTYSIYGLLAAGSRFVGDYDEEAAIEHYLELHPEADEVAVRAELLAEISRREGSTHGESLIDPRSTPYSSSEQIAAEIEEIRRLQPGRIRDATIQAMQGWIDDKQEGKR